MATDSSVHSADMCMLCVDGVDDVYDSDYIDEDEIEALLDEDLKKKKGSDVSNDLTSNRKFTIKEKTVLIGTHGKKSDVILQCVLRSTSLSQNHTLSCFGNRRLVLYGTAKLFL